MPSKDSQFVYWDSCVFLAYIKQEPGRVEILDDLWDEISRCNNMQIITSSISVVEVTYGTSRENRDALDQEKLSKIDLMWRDTSIVMVELTPDISFRARELMRDAIPQGWRLKTYDAVHLATAKWVNQYTNAVNEFHTYDEKLNKYETMIGFHICEPQILQPKLKLEELSIQ